MKMQPAEVDQLSQTVNPEVGLCWMQLLVKADIQVMVITTIYVLDYMPHLE